MGLFLTFLFGCVLMAGPIAARIFNKDIGTFPTTVCMILGAAFVLLSFGLFVITKLYVRTKASEAFVRTGWGGMVVVKDGGALVVPVVHEIVRVSLESLRLEVERKGVDALITEDKLRADVKAEFFVRVQPDDDSIKAAARSFGDKVNDRNYVRSLVEDKLVSALRTVAATRKLEDLNAQRDAFVADVTRIVTQDLAHNGLTLEGVTISKLDQTDPGTLRDDNIFDAQGKRTIAETTQAQLTKRNELVREGEQARKAQDVAARQRMLELEQVQAQAEAEQQARIAEVRAEQERLAKQKQIDAARQVELAEVAKMQAIEVAGREREQAVIRAEGEKQKADAMARQTVEVAEQERQQQVARAEAERALAEAKLAEAAAERERAQQAVQTVEVTMQAEREKQKSVINAQAKAETEYVSLQRAADAQAYRVEREAAAKQTAAEAEASAVVRAANAAAEAQTKQASAAQFEAEAQAAGQKAAALARAEGMKAEALVPVEAERQRVAVQAQAIENLAKELKTREDHGKAGQDFEVAKLRIQVEGEVRKEFARAMGSFGAKFQANVFGTPDTVTALLEKFSQGAGASAFLDGARQTMSSETQEVVTKFANAVGDSVKESVAAFSGSGGRSKSSKHEVIEGKQA